MGLDISEIKKRITEPKKRNTINRAIYHQQRINFHARTRITSFDICQPITDFMAFVSNLLPHDKFKMFKNIVPLPR